ncbi:MAG: ATP-binding protein, partial [Nostocaceae cyanobacterium]|nr:ATP-binding protein [Nostocaceae cyanobacterium]
LRVKQDIDNEDKARGILGNFSKISAKTQPIVLCFDQLDNIGRLPDGSIDLQALFNVTSTIYNGAWKGFLIIISIRTSTWNNNYKRVQPSDLDRASLKVRLKRITLQEVESLLATRLYALHQQAEEQPSSAIYPLTQSVLMKEFPSQKASPRQALTLGKQLFQEYKEGLIKEPGNEPPLPPPTHPIIDKIQAEFKLLWQQEYKKVQGKITKITLVAIPDLIRMLQEALTALQVQGVKPKLLTGRFANNSLSYQQPSQKKRIGIVWTEDPGMRPFFDIMSACQKALDNDQYQILQLVRAGDVGNPKLAGNQIFRQIFTHTQHHHIRPNLSSVHYLVTYHNLVNSAMADELVVAGKSINLKELQDLIRQCQIFQDCFLLQELKIVSSDSTKLNPDTLDLQPIKNYLLNLVITQQFMGRKALTQNAREQFVQISESQIQQLLYQLCEENKVKIINPKAKPEAQTICLVV